MTACPGLNRVCLFPALVSRRCNYVGASRSANCCTRAYFIPIRVRRVARATRIPVYPQLREINLDRISGGPLVPRQRFFPLFLSFFPPTVSFHFLSLFQRISSTLTTTTCIGLLFASLQNTCLLTRKKAAFDCLIREASPCFRNLAHVDLSGYELFV